MATRLSDEYLHGYSKDDLQKKEYVRRVLEQMIGQSKKGMSTEDRVSNLEALKKKMMEKGTVKYGRTSEQVDEIFNEASRLASEKGMNMGAGGSSTDAIKQLAEKLSAKKASPAKKETKASSSPPATSPSSSPSPMASPSPSPMAKPSSSPSPMAKPSSSPSPMAKPSSSPSPMASPSPSSSSSPEAKKDAPIDLPSRRLTISSPPRFDSAPPSVPDPSAKQKVDDMLREDLDKKFPSKSSSIFSGGEKKLSMDTQDREDYLARRNALAPMRRDPGYYPTAGEGESTAQKAAKDSNSPKPSPSPGPSPSSTVTSSPSPIASPTSAPPANVRPLIRSGTDTGTREGYRGSRALSMFMDEAAKGGRTATGITASVPGYLSARDAASNAVLERGANLLPDFLSKLGPNINLSDVDDATRGGGSIFDATTNSLRRIGESARDSLSRASIRDAILRGMESLSDSVTPESVRNMGPEYPAFSGVLPGESSGSTFPEIYGSYANALKSKLAGLPGLSRGALDSAIGLAETAGRGALNAARNVGPQGVGTAYPFIRRLMDGDLVGAGMDATTMASLGALASKFPQLAELLKNPRTAGATLGASSAYDMANDLQGAFGLEPSPKLSALAGGLGGTVGGYVPQSSVPLALGALGVHEASNLTKPGGMLDFSGPQSYLTKMMSPPPIGAIPGYLR